MGLIISSSGFTQPAFKGSYPSPHAALCSTAQSTLDYLNKGRAYDPEAIHDDTLAHIPLHRIKATLAFICAHQQDMNNPKFLQQHFSFIPWYPDLSGTKTLAKQKPLLRNLPKNHILMTKYFVHMAKASPIPQSNKPYALYALPLDEQHLSIQEAESRPYLTRFHYGKRAILHGALNTKKVPILAYLNREDLESALLQGTLVADFGPLGTKVFNVHRCNNIPYDRAKSPYEQERFWYFKAVDGIKGYGKDADYKITINPEVSFAGNIQQLGLGSLLMVQYPNPSGTMISRIGILADTGGAFANNLYQIDYLAGSYSGTKAFSQATKHLPDYVTAYFMVLKEPNP